MCVATLNSSREDGGSKIVLLDYVSLLFCQLAFNHLCYLISYRFNSKKTPTWTFLLCLKKTQNLVSDDAVVIAKY